MSKRFDRLSRSRVQALYSYTIALEHGDAETLARVLHLAEQDAVLERMILELHDASLSSIETSKIPVEHEDVLTEQNNLGRKRIQNAMNYDMNAITYPIVNEVPSGKKRKRSRVADMFQALAAVLVVGALVSSFAFLLAHRPGSPGSTQKGSGQVMNAKSFIVVVADSSGLISGLRSTDGKVLWQYKTGEQEVDTMVQQNGAVYISTLPGVSGNDLYKLRLSDGTLLWKKNFPQLSGFSVFTVDGNTLAISGGEGDGSMNVVSTKDGSLLWRYTPAPGNSSWSYPMIAERNNVIYIRINKGMEAFQFNTGKLLWTSYASSAVQTLVFDGNTMYAVNSLNSYDWVVTALHVQNGTLIKEIHITFPSQGTVYQSGYSGDILYASKQVVQTGVTHNQACAIHIADGTTLWCTPDIPNISIWSPLLSMNNNFYFMQVGQDSTWQVNAFNGRNGSLLWHWTNPSGHTTSSMNDVSIVGADGIVFVTSPQGFFALSGSNGHVLWQALLGFHPPLFTLPAVPNWQQILPN